MIRSSLSAAALTLACAAGCGSPAAPPDGPEQWLFEGPIMGTSYRVLVPVDEAAQGLGKEKLGELVLAELTDVDDRMSTWKPDSEVSRFNSHRSTQPFSVSASTLVVVEQAQQVSEATEGAFDITVGPLIDAWGFGAAEPGPPPDEAQLATLDERVGYTRLVVDPAANTLSKEHPDLHINLSAIAKGYAVDRVVSALAGEGVNSALVEVGGEVYALGRPEPGRQWRVAVERPDGSGATQRIIELENQALATSGDYRNFRLLDDGTTASHLFDPRIGRPIQHASASVSVTAADCANADAWATALFVLGPRQAVEVQLPEDLSAVFILHGQEGWDELQLP